MSLGMANPTPRLPSAGAVGADGGVHPDDATLEVSEGPAGVAGVDRGVGLEHLDDRRRAVGDVDVLDDLADRADDAGRDALVEPERAADGNGTLAQSHRVRRGEHRRDQFDVGIVEAHDRDVDRRSGADDGAGRRGCRRRDAR